MRAAIASFAYRVAGVVLSSETPLPTLVAVSVGADESLASVTFGMGGPQTGAADDFELAYDVAVAPGRSELFMSVSRGAKGYRMRVHGVADFVVVGACEHIVCAPLAPLDPEIIEQLLVDQILPRALQLRGQPCLHASAVEVRPGRVTALVGHSGAGKSTLSAALTRRGAPLVCDDCLAVEVQGDVVRVHPGYPSLRLLADSAAALEGDDAELPLATPRTTKRRVRRPASAGPLRLERLVMLQPADVLRPTLTKLSRSAAVMALTAFVHRLEPRDARLLDGEFRLLTQVAASVDTFSLVFGHRFEQLDSVVHLLG